MICNASAHVDPSAWWLHWPQTTKVGAIKQRSATDHSGRIGPVGDTIELEWRPLGIVKSNKLRSVVVISSRSGEKLKTWPDILTIGERSTDLELIGANNSQAEKREVETICHAEGAVCILGKENLSYSDGRLLGELKATGNYAPVIKPDVKFSRSSVQLLWDSLKSNSDVFVLDPLQSGTHGSGRGKRRATGENKSTINRTICKVTSLDKLVPTSFLSGSALLFRNAAFDRIGGCDDNMFLCFEDDDLCLRLTELGRLAYASGVLAQHDCETKTPKSADLTWSWASHFGYVKVYGLRKHRGCACSHFTFSASRGEVFEPLDSDTSGSVEGTS